MSTSTLRLERDADAVARAAAELFAASAHEALGRAGRFVVALAGGSTPRRLYEHLADEPHRSRLPWGATVVLFGDERCVAPDHPASNYHMAREALLDHVALAPENVHRLRGELDPAEAAHDYEALLRREPRIDLLLLGIGADGHTASLFPGTTALEERDAWVVANHVPQLGEWRLTLTLPALSAARQVVFLATGASKARVVAEAFGGAAHPLVHPCELVVPADGERVVFVDREAAAGLPGTDRQGSRRAD